MGQEGERRPEGPNWMENRPARPAHGRCHPALNRMSGPETEACVRALPRPGHLPVALSLSGSFSPLSTGGTVWSASSPAIHPDPEFPGASPSCVSALLVTAGFFGPSLSAHSFPLGVSGLGTVRTGTPPFWETVRQVPGVQEVRFCGVIGRGKEPGGREADPAGQPVLQTVLGLLPGDHTEEGWTDVTALWLLLGLGGNLDLTRWSHQAGWRSRTEERVFSLEWTRSRNPGRSFLRCPWPGAGVSALVWGGTGACCPLPPSSPRGLRPGVAESAEGQAPGPGQVPKRKVEREAGGWKAWAWPVPRGGGGRGTGQEGPCHVAQEMAALCSLAFMRRAAMLEVLRSGSPLSS